MNINKLNRSSHRYRLSETGSAGSNKNHYTKTIKKHYYCETSKKSRSNQLSKVYDIAFRGVPKGLLLGPKIHTGKIVRWYKPNLSVNFVNCT